MNLDTWYAGVSWCRQADVPGNDCMLSSTCTVCTTWLGSRCRTPCGISWRRCATCGGLTTSTSAWSDCWSTAALASQTNVEATAYTNTMVQWIIPSWTPHHSPFLPAAPQKRTSGYIMVHNYLLTRYLQAGRSGSLWRPAGPVNTSPRTDPSLWSFLSPILAWSCSPSLHLQWHHPTNSILTSPDVRINIFWHLYYTDILSVSMNVPESFQMYKVETYLTR